MFLLRELRKNLLVCKLEINGKVEERRIIKFFPRFMFPKKKNGIKDKTMYIVKVWF